MRYWRTSVGAETSWIAPSRMHPGDVLGGDSDRVAALTDGTAEVGGVQRRWSTVGLYQIRDGRVAGCWLPLDPAAFDDIWTGSDGRSVRS